MLIPHARYELGRIAHAYCILASLCEAWGESKLAAEYVEEAEWVMMAAAAKIGVATVSESDESGGHVFDVQAPS